MTSGGYTREEAYALQVAAKAKAILDVVHQLKRADPQHALAEAGKLGAKVRYISGTYEMRLMGVAATCAAGGPCLADAWIRAAYRKLDRMKAP
jgi:hypothetical protein